MTSLVGEEGIYSANTLRKAEIHGKHTIRRHPPGREEQIENERRASISFCRLVTPYHPERTADGGAAGVFILLLVEVTHSGSF